MNQNRIKDLVRDICDVVVGLWLISLIVGFGFIVPCGVVILYLCKLFQ